jgi:hypothetical protein
MRRRGSGWTRNNTGNEGNVDIGSVDCFSRSGHVELGRITDRGYKLEHDWNATHARVMLQYEKFRGNDNIILTI